MRNDLTGKQQRERVFLMKKVKAAPTLLAVALVVAVVMLPLAAGHDNVPVHPDPSATYKPAKGEFCSNRWIYNGLPLGDPVPYDTHPIHDTQAYNDHSFYGSAFAQGQYTHGEREIYPGCSGCTQSATSASSSISSVHSFSTPATSPSQCSCEYRWYTDSWVNTSTGVWFDDSVVPGKSTSCTVTLNVGGSVMAIAESKDANPEEGTSSELSRNVQVSSYWVWETYDTNKRRRKWTYSITDTEMVWAHVSVCSYLYSDQPLQEPPEPHCQGGSASAELKGWPASFPTLKVEYSDY